MSDFATCCVLSYNRPELLQESLLTLVGNARYPLELIVHDDGSMDEDLREWLFAACQSGTISTLILNPPGHNQGQGTALNRMFNMAKGDPIIKLDHDLVYMPGWLAQCVSVLEHNKDNPMQPRIGVMGLFKYNHDPVDYRKMHRTEWEGWDEVEDFVGSALVVPREVWEAFGPFPEHSDAFAEDQEFKFRVRDDRRCDWRLALPSNDLAVNQGFGIGPSTVNTHDGGVASIHKEPHVLKVTEEA